MCPAPAGRLKLTRLRSVSHSVSWLVRTPMTISLSGCPRRVCLYQVAPSVTMLHGQSAEQHCHDAGTRAPSCVSRQSRPTRSSRSSCLSCTTDNLHSKCKAAVVIHTWYGRLFRCQSPTLLPNSTACVLFNIQPHPYLHDCITDILVWKGASPGGVSLQLPVTGYSEASFGATELERIGLTEILFLFKIK